MYIGLHVEHPLFLFDFNESCIFSADFRKILKYLINENPFSGSRVVPRGRTDGRKDMKLIVACRNFANEPPPPLPPKPLAEVLN